MIADCHRVALEEAGVREGDVAYVATTGEGELVDFRRGHFYGMTTHARGAIFLIPSVRAVLDIGALHARMQFSLRDGSRGGAEIAEVRGDVHFSSPRPARLRVSLLVPVWVLVWSGGTS